MNLPNGNIISELNDIPLLHGSNNSLISTSCAYEFGVYFHYIAKCCFVKYYIHAGDRIIPMIFYNSLLYVSIK